jgi:hypothetical protein
VERQVSVTCVVAITLWMTSFGLILAGSVLGLTTGADHLPIVLALMSHGLALSAAAASVTVRRCSPSRTAYSATPSISAATPTVPESAGFADLSASGRADAKTCDAAAAACTCRSGIRWP